MKDENRESMLPTSTLRNCTDDALQAIIVDSEEDIFEMRQQNAEFGRQWPVSKPHLLKAHRRQIARCHTILSERYSSGSHRRNA